ncbi:recombinase family protein [Vibrio parahaemolyticus]|uniref:recombinase family protein n=1 Tax=Vibrio parahaemolyticus TaxID=670 RepID=UPI00111D03A1|nr:recombinase family protein [Vibrio parahaemolyticus]ELB2964395.1 recombinase family protein [Vibrio parahaemolyticus]MBE3723774.1 recombinase family protein [Vibrio parahaemolyticus]MBE3783830.1 recombinase family protein [Vibrio parahaemolyticus]MBE3938429.1 recombinase family protein [Vibrio parahaemolyticus]TOB56838.1 recombinase [Vibrio parahaemolyticus]
MTTYIYTRYSPKNKAHSEHLAALREAAPDALHFEDKIRGCVPPSEREAFQKLSNTIQSGDTIVMWWLTAFGRDFSQALNAIRALLEKGVTLKTVCEPLTFEPDSEQTKTLLALLSGYGKVQIQHRLFAAEQGRQAIKDQPDLWKQKFRGRPADREKHRLIAALLLEGNTLLSVAEQCDVSLSTVKRVKAKLSEFDEDGALRTRKKCRIRRW